MNKIKSLVNTILTALVLMYAGIAVGRIIDIAQKNPGATFSITIDKRLAVILLVVTVVVSGIAVWTRSDDEDEKPTG